MLSIIYPYRERDLDRIRFSLNSLSKQTNKMFEVYFVDYGSTKKHANQVEALLKSYDFVNYVYHYTEFQPWNKSKALNSVIKNLDTDYFFVADIDMIFHPNFIEVANELAKENDVWYFQVGFLDQEVSKAYREFSAYNIKFKSGKEATGLTLCPVKAAKRIQGFDEFYHFWGSEDTDFHVRLAHAKYKINYYDDSILLLHQWHKIYRNKEVPNLTKSLQLSGIVQFNQNYLRHVIANRTTIVNSNSWGVIQKENDFKLLNSFSKDNTKTISLSMVEIDFFLFHTLPSLRGTHYYIFKAESSKLSLKKTVKGLIQGKKDETYSLKEVNDKVLFHIINFYHNYPYNFYVNTGLDSIHFSIVK